MSSKYNTQNLKVFDNEVLSIIFENQLITAMDMTRFAHADYSLTEHAGMKKKIRQYTGTGSVKEVAMTEGNGDDVCGAYFQEIEYEVGTTQLKGRYYDEQFMDDPDAVNKMIQYMTEEMTNDMTRKIVLEMLKAVQVKYNIQVGFDVISDAIAEFPDESTERESLFLLISRADSSLWRKALKDDLKYVEAFVRKGYIGTVCGVPIYWNDAVPKGEAFVATPEAVTIFIKKGVESETFREPDTRRNDLYLRKVMLVALENANKLIRLTTSAGPTGTVTAECSNTGVVIEMNNQEINVGGFDVVAGIPDAYKTLFPLPCNKGVVLVLKGIIPAGGADVIQVNEALKPYYEAESPDITRKGNRYIKTKHYDGDDADLAIICEPQKIATVTVDGITYTINPTFQLK